MLQKEGEQHAGECQATSGAAVGELMQITALSFTERSRHCGATSSDH